MRTNYLIRDKRSGRIFATRAQAAKHYGVSHQTICNYCKVNAGKSDRGTLFEDIQVELLSITKLNQELAEMRRELREAHEYVREAQAIREAQSA